MTKFSSEQLAILQKQANETEARFRQAFQQAYKQGSGTVFCFKGYYYCAYTPIEYLRLTKTQQEDMERRIMACMMRDKSPITLSQNMMVIRKQWGDSPYGADALNTLNDMLQDELTAEEHMQTEEEEEDAYEHLLAHIANNELQTI